MKKVIWDNLNKMHMETGYKLFDRQTNVISYGNVYANTQSSGYIRPYAEIECNGTIRKPGELMKYDLQCIFGEHLRNYNLVPQTMKWKLEDVKRDKSLILYKFFVWKHGEQRIIGFVLTDKDYHLIDYKAVNYYGDSSYMKRHFAIMEAARYVCNDTI